MDTHGNASHERRSARQRAQPASVSFRLDQRTRSFEAVKGISFDIPRNSTVALVGESGSGKSVTSLAILGLLPPENSIVDPASEILYGGTQPRRTARSATLRELRGADISMIFQEPMTSLNPVFTVGFQLDRGAAPAHGHDARAGAQARDRAAATRSASRTRSSKHQRVSVADVRRPAAARDDRDGDRLRAEAPDRRRADDRARRDDPEADPRPDRRAAEEAPDVGAVHHARPRGGRRDRRLRRRDAQRRDPRAGARQGRVRDAAGHVHAGAAAAAGRSSIAGRRGCR